MLNEWSDRVDPHAARSWWRVALDWAIGAMVASGAIIMVFQLLARIV